MLNIFVDADGCPVKEEVYKVAMRYQLKVCLAANRYMQIPQHPNISLTIVDKNIDAADDWIADQAEQEDIVITADIPLADRSIKKGAFVITPRGHEFTEDNIGDAIASRELMNTLRDMGEISGGPASFSPKDRSAFLSKLDQIIQKIKRLHR